MKNILNYTVLFITTLLIGCSNNYSSGERVGMITQFSKTGLIWDSWEGQLNMTQTGMNSSTEFDFSLDNDKVELQDKLIPVLDSAAHNGWKVALKYTEVFGFNVLFNRGDTKHFIDSVVVLDKNPLKGMFSNDSNASSKTRDTIYIGHRDTIYVVLKK